MTTLHDVKVEPRWFDRIQQNEKFAEVRYDDRDYQTGDRIRFRRNDGQQYWSFVERKITHVLRCVDGIEDGYVVLSLSDPRVEELKSRLDAALSRERTADNRIRGLRGHITRLQSEAAKR